MKERYRVLVVGMGKRGMHHAAAFQANGRFELAGVCSTSQARLDAAAAKLGVTVKSTDARQLALALRPDVFCFCTPPGVRTEMAQIAIECGARMVAMEKPVALTSAEGMQIRDMLGAAGVKAVVSHQHRYGAHYQKAKEAVQSGQLGRIHTVYGTATGWMMHMLSHLIDYMRWFNGEAGAEWVMAQASGRGKLADAHPSPDYIAGFIQFSNGVRGVVECGAGAPDVPEVDYWWRKCRIGAMGADGFAEVLTGGGWRVVSKQGSGSGEGSMNYDLDMPPYIQQIAEWMDDEQQVHPCNFASAWEGFEIMMACCRSAANGGQIELPLSVPANEIEMLRSAVPSRNVLFSMRANAKEYAS